MSTSQHRRLASLAAAALATAVVVVLGLSTRDAEASHDCGLPDSAPLWIEYGEGATPREVRDVWSRPGVVVAASGSAIPQQYRSSGAATVHFVLRLPQWVGEPATPADAASIPEAVETVYRQAVTSTGGCTKPWIGLNELLGPAAPVPWTANVGGYRGNVLALMRGLAAKGARPALFVHGNPAFAGQAAPWWKAVGEAGHVVYEAYYDAPNIARLGAVLGNRRMRLGMRAVVDRFVDVGIPRGRIGLALGFQVAPGASGREGLQPRERWLEVVKWEALAAQQVARDEKLASIWSWGWGNFGPQSVDPDKPAAACVYLWARDPKLCDGVRVAGTGFDVSRTAGQIALRAGTRCTWAGGSVLTASVADLVRLVGHRYTATTVLFGRSAFRTQVRVRDADVLAEERRIVDASFGGSRAAYLTALARRKATLAIARGVITDELRRRTAAATAAPGRTVLSWFADTGTVALQTATCLRDEVPGFGDFPRSDQRDLDVIPLGAFLPFLFTDVAPPAAPAGLTATAAPRSVALAWAPGTEADLAGYRVMRASSPGGPYTQLNELLLPRPTFVDTTAAAGAPSYYVVHAVDTSGRFAASVEVAAAPA